MIKRIIEFILGLFGKRVSKFDKAMESEQFFIDLNHDDLENHLYTDTLLVSCVDFRFRGENSKMMNQIFNLTGDYDEVALPGSSLALVEKSYPDWGKSLVDVMNLLKKIHRIKRVIFLDHRDCGAYRFIKGAEAVSTKEKETETHKEVFKEVRLFMKNNFPELKVYTLLIGLDGVIENIKE
jgi:hypothetical protein